MRFLNIDTIITLFGLLFSIITIDRDNLSNYKNWGLYLIAGTLFIGFIVSIIRANNKQKGVNEGQSMLMDLLNRLNQIEIEKIGYVECNMKMIQLCSRLSEAFTKIKGFQISVSIKYINSIDGIEYIETLSRDVHSMNDGKREYTDFPKDKLCDNSDFEDIMLQHYKNRRKWHQIYYLRNCLPTSFGYYNSHLDESELHNGIIGALHRYNHWPLQYKSTLIVPISNVKNDSFYGFLCLDSKKIQVFNKNKDIELLKLISSNIWQFVNITIIKNLKKAVD